MSQSFCSREFQLPFDEIHSAVNCFGTVEMNEARIPVLRLRSPGNPEECKLKQYSGFIFENSMKFMRM
jgi:hypothetical protein